MNRTLIVLATLAVATSVPAANLKLGAIPKSTGGEFWETVAKGARKAAADLNVDLR